MDSNKLSKIIDFIREEMMTTGSTAGKPGLSGKADAIGPTAGFDTAMGTKKKRYHLSMRFKKALDWQKSSWGIWLNWILVEQKIEDLKPIML